VSIPRENKTQKNKMAHKFGNGRVVKAAGKTIKARSGPLKGNSLRGFPLIKLILPM
jgi:hypothetical protein